MACIKTENRKDQPDRPKNPDTRRRRGKNKATIEKEEALEAMGSLYGAAPAISSKPPRPLLLHSDDEPDGIQPPDPALLASDDEPDKIQPLPRDEKVSRRKSSKTASAYLVYSQKYAIRNDKPLVKSTTKRTHRPSICAHRVKRFHITYRNSPLSF